MPEQKLNSHAWADVDEEEATRPLTRQEAQAFRERHPQVSAWRVVAAQAALGGVLAALAWWLRGDTALAASALYGAAVVVVPGALMARQAGAGVHAVSPVAAAVRFMSWVVVKIGCSVLMLILAPRIVQSLSWPALLVAMVLCMQVYWLALLWRRPGTESTRKDKTGPRAHGN